MVLYMFKSSITIEKNVECHFPKSEQVNDFQFTEKTSQKLQEPPLEGLLESLNTTENA